MRVILVLILGLGGGYYLGYSDASSGKPSVVARLVGKATGKVRSEVNNGMDGTVRRTRDSVSAINKRLQEHERAMTTP